MTSARGIRNRNPGNIIVSGWTTRQEGYTGPEPQGRFATFATMADGVTALLRLLMVYRDQHGLKTIRGIINRWAPPQENETTAYVAAVAKALGVDPDEELPAEAPRYVDLARAIVMHENGREAATAVTTEDYADAARRVFTYTFAPPPAPAPQWPFDREMEGNDMAPLAAAALPALAPVLAKVLEILPWFSSGSKSAERNVAVAKELGPTLVELLGKVTPTAVNVQQAVDQVLANPTLRQSFVAAAAPHAAEMMTVWEMSEKAVQSAREAELAFLAAGYEFWRSPSFWVALFLLPLVYMVVISMMFKGAWLPDWPFEARTNIAGLIVGMIIGGLMGYYFGMMTSRNRVAQATK